MAYSAGTPQNDSRGETGEVMHAAANTHYVVLYSVSGERQTGFEEGIRSRYTWWHYTTNAMLICTNESPEVIFKHLSAWTVPGQDQFLIFELRQNGLRRAQTAGFPNEKKAWDWLNEHLGPQRSS